MTFGKPSAAALAGILSLLLCALASLWLTAGVAPWEGDRANLWHHYEYLADGFLHGHTYLSVEPAPELARLRDPYDPAANEPYRLWDASLYQGKYYLYYGPTPALALMGPFQALTGRTLPQRTAVAVFAIAGMAALARLLWEVRLRHFPGVSAAAYGLVLLVAFHASWLPVTLRRPGVWELPIVAADACLWAALYFLWRFHDSGRRAGWALATGVSLALLMGSRVTSVFAAGLVTLLLLVPAAGGPSRGGPWREAALGALAAAAGGLALLAYNHARFGSWGEFGQSYQLWGLNERHLRHFDPSFIPFNARLYLTSVPVLSPYFPFLRGAWPSPPDGYIATEEMQGVLFVMPVHLAGLCAAGWAWARRGSAAARPLAVTLAAAAGASLLAAAILFCFAGACSRYVTELMGGWSVLTAVGLFVLLGRPGERGARARRHVAVAAGAWTMAGVWLASAEFRGFMRQTEPRAYRAVAHLLDLPSSWRIRSLGVVFGPLELDLRVPASAKGDTVVVASGRPQMVDQLIVSPTDAGHARLVLAENSHITLETGPLELRQGRLHVLLQAPWLYPPPEHPYWDAYSPESRARLQALVSVTVDGKVTTSRSVHPFDAASFEPAVLGASEAAPGSPYVETIARAPAPR
jgi:hypothetical protein